jgi:hypothetical protein
VSSANTSLLTRARIRVDPGQPVPPVELGLLRGDASLDGRFVETYSYEWGVRLVSELPGGAEFETETGLGDGGFRFAGLAPGFYTLQVYAQHCNEEPRVIHEEPVWLPAERPVPVRLSGGDRRGQAVAAAPPRP